GPGRVAGTMRDRQCLAADQARSWLSWGSLTGQHPLAQSWALMVGRLSWFNRSM
ncbi:unnamed protein product, partial [Bubo scandiacus]